MRWAFVFAGTDDGQSAAELGSAARRFWLQASPNTTVGKAQFGRVTGMANSPRQTQFALKLLF